jgi:hypothetical protein
VAIEKRIVIGKITMKDDYRNKIVNIKGLKLRVKINYGIVVSKRHR